jgi:hypothetical protein
MNKAELIDHFCMAPFKEKIINEPLPDCPVCDGDGLFKSRTKTTLYCICVTIPTFMTDDMRKGIVLRNFEGLEIADIMMYEHDKKIKDELFGDKKAP